MSLPDADTEQSDTQRRTLLRVRWAVRGALVLGVAATVFGNVLHAEPNTIARAISAWPPLALLITIELIARVPVERPARTWARRVAAAIIGGIAAWVSYWHLAGVALRYGESPSSAHLLPLSVDGLVVVASVCLVELTARLRVMERVEVSAPAASDTSPDTPADSESDTPEQPVAPPVPAPRPPKRTSPRLVALKSSPDIEPTDGGQPSVEAMADMLAKHHGAKYVGTPTAATTLRKVYGTCSQDRAMEAKKLHNSRLPRTGEDEAADDAEERQPVGASA